MNDRKHADPIPKLCGGCGHEEEMHDPAKRAHPGHCRGEDGGAPCKCLSFRVSK